MIAAVQNKADNICIKTEESNSSKARLFHLTVAPVTTGVTVLLTDFELNYRIMV
jgi:hypothetical protein